ncbi:MAG: hypothetical protein SFV15_00355 [Polyangiaceae bacterium]|nr:hypothetical protein [Polyangiaceae bacterium]
MRNRRGLRHEHGLFGRRRSLWAAAFLALGAWSLFGTPSCNQKETPSISGNTNWLKPCVRDAECGSELLCRCGVCSGACDGTLDCSLPPAEICVARVNAQGGSGGATSGGSSGTGGAVPQVETGGATAAGFGGMLTQSGGSGGAGPTGGLGSDVGGAGGTPAGGGSGGGGALNTGGAGGSAPIVCTGPTLDGSFVIHNSLDVASIANIGTITGSLQIDAPGLSTISLPALCSAGAIEELTAPDLTTLDLSGLKTVNGFAVTGAPLATIELGNLVHAGDLSVSLTGPLDLPKLETAGAIFPWGISTLTAPKLRSAGGVFVDSSVASAEAPVLEQVGDLNLQLNANSSVAFPSLVTAGNMILKAPTQSLGFPKLTSVTQGIAIDASGTGQSFSFPLLTSTGGSFSVAGATSLSFPLLASTGGSFSVAGVASLSLPALATIGGDASIHAQGTSLFVFPQLVSVVGDLNLVPEGASMSFPKLKSVHRLGSIVGTGDSSQLISFGALETLTWWAEYGIGGDGGAIEVTLAGKFSAPALKHVAFGLFIGGVSDLDLSGLQSTGDQAGSLCGGYAWTSVLKLKDLQMSRVLLPSLQHSCLYVGDGFCSANAKGSNPTLQEIVAPQLISGGLLFFGNPAFPQCRIDALRAQMTGGCALWPGSDPLNPKVAQCPTASGPCP